MPGHYLDTEWRQPPRDRGAQARNDAYRHDSDDEPVRGTIHTWFNDDTQRWGYTIRNAAGEPLRSGCGWRSLTETLAAAREFIIL